MLKVIWLVNPLLFKSEDADYPKWFCQQSSCTLTVVFLHQHFFEAIPVFTGDPMFPTVDFSLVNEEVNQQYLTSFNASVSSFKKVCNEKQLSFNEHDGKGDAVDEIIMESRFADLLLVHSSLSLVGDESGTPSILVKKVLSKAECPVFVMPDDKQEIKEIYFTYNGGESSMYAIRQFTHLFPGLRTLPVTVLSVKEKDDAPTIPFEDELKDYLSIYYSFYRFRVVRGNPEAEIVAALMHKKNIIVTFGAFGRSNVSRFLKGSSADMVLEVIDIPLFITHP